MKACQEKETILKGYTMIPTADLSREEWLRLRKTGIGWADAGAVGGFNPYRSSMAVYQDKTSEEIENEDNEAMHQGLGGLCG